MTFQITKCVACNYEALTYGSEECKRCGGKLEVIASEDKKDLKNRRRNDRISNKI